MIGPQARNIRQRGVEYTIRNATDSSGDRTTPSYSDDGTLVGVLERRGMATVETLSSGDEVETDLELRAVVDDSGALVEAAEDDWPTKLEHPDGLVYRVLAKYPEDSGVTVLTLERE
jgi:hypothetical protein